MEYEDAITQIVGNQRDFVDRISRESTGINHDYLPVANINQQSDLQFDQGSVIHEIAKQYVAFILSLSRRSCKISINQLINGLEAISLQTPISEMPPYRNIQICIWKLRSRITMRNALYTILPPIQAIIDDHDDDESQTWLETLIRLITDPQSDLDYIPPMIGEEEPEHLISIIHCLYV